MPQFPCAALNSLAKRLREKYDVRSKIIVRNIHGSDLLAVETEIMGINKLITRHRRTCLLCKRQESRVAMSRNLRPISLEPSRVLTNMPS